MVRALMGYEKGGKPKNAAKKPATGKTAGKGKSGK
jgi:hypothetical protein